MAILPVCSAAHGRQGRATISGRTPAFTLLLNPTFVTAHLLPDMVEESQGLPAGPERRRLQPRSPSSFSSEGH
jgi:hypothetical protein